jgi:hypothetical protein
MNSLQPQYGGAGEEDLKSKGIKRLGMVERGVCISGLRGAKSTPLPTSHSYSYTG